MVELALSVGVRVGCARGVVELAVRVGSAEMVDVAAAGGVGAMLSEATSE